jgi:hypothetical protein
MAVTNFQALSHAIPAARHTITTDSSRKDDSPSNIKASKIAEKIKRQGPRRSPMKELFAWETDDLLRNSTETRVQPPRKPAAAERMSKACHSSRR